MKRKTSHRLKIIALAGIIGLYLLLGILFKTALAMGILERAPPSIISIGGNDTLLEIEPRTIKPNLEAAQVFFEERFSRNNGHIDLYIGVGGNDSFTDLSTNSEAVSYSLLRNANAKDKKAFDEQLLFIESKMTHPHFGYLMWRLEENDTVHSDGSNIATDADLRAIKALLIAEKQWKDRRYTKMIDQFAKGIETMAITKDGYLAPYGGVSGETAKWGTEEVWLSYEDFTVFKELSERRGKPWNDLYAKMKSATIGAQIENGLYNSQLTLRRDYGNGIDGGGYSINSMWMMVRSAESDDADLKASANKSLEFYKKKFQQDAEIYATYDSNANALSPSDTPWAYALVGRAAIALGDIEFADRMMGKLLEKQVTDEKSPLFGAFPEGHGENLRIGQFTMQESIITMQDYLRSKEQGKK